jgi:excisionase family DNA binding protein
MDDHLSTEQMSWILGRSAETVREMIRDGEIEGARIPAGFRVPKAEALRVARERIEAEAGRKLSDRELERLIDELIERNTAASEP